MSYSKDDPRRRGLLQQYSPLELSVNWSKPQTFRVKSVRTVALAGTGRLSLQAFSLEQAVGCIELTGSKAGSVFTSLFIGFTLGPDAPAATFSLNADHAVGTMTLPASLFAAYLQLVSGPCAHFCIGGDGSCNAVGSDSYFLKELEA